MFRAEFSGGRLIGRRLVIARCAAGITVQKAVGAQADIHYRLAQTAEFLAFTAGLRLFALRAAISCGTGSGAHEDNFTRLASSSKHDVGNGEHSIQRHLRV